MTHSLSLLRTICRSLWYYVRTGYPMSGHTDVEEFYGQAWVSVCKCEVCGRYHVSWSKEDLR